jgi:hypothetical protein
MHAAGTRSRTYDIHVRIAATMYDAVNTLSADVSVPLSR